MHLVCPKCATSYQLNATAVGAGRTVRCARCKNVWFARLDPPPGPADTDREEAAFRQELGAVAPTAAPAEPPGSTAAAGEPASDISVLARREPEAPSAASYLKTPAVDSPPLAPESAAANTPKTPTEPEDVESVAARRMPPDQAARRQRAAPHSRLSLLILLLLAACTAIIAWRKDIVRHAPQMASLYRLLGMPVNVRGLVFADLKIASETHDGVPVLTVEGTIVSVVSEAVEVPRLRFALLNGAGQEIYSWTAMPTQTLLAPGETLPFRSRIASPPGDVQDVQVRFFKPQDAASGGG